ncbi:hypothetical protein P9B97_02290 [Bacillus paralicheniformis]|uniref:hypothetical protein n=1 Tax=Bacillus paralicheniformis TaxID=1648923 RepID=UPI002DBC5B70|nr:hypothetical protein [Bacillus paralicheniformis]MEC1050911.1 hypothetical protein [Bacillus paralicheniformis]MEC1085057.1 hypothetical protein [Bacillus paralicheniformis]MEC1108857.1 hypothetical protein [Bacillus paralicheniformis]MEC1137165.1 hypothetical protein [Bacillus paralicheniformis]MEC1148080.1 hypothetical protein [Bacillus paralicheniformis]
MSKQIDQIQKVNYGQIKEALQTFYQKHHVIMTEEMGRELFDIVDLIDKESRNLQDIKELIYKIGSKM